LNNDVAEEIPKSLLDMATLDMNAFKSVVSEILNLYENGSIRMIFAGGASGAKIAKTNISIIVKKYNIDRTTVRRAVTAFLRCVHMVLTNEHEDALEMAKKAKDVRTAEGFREKIEFIEDMVDKHPSIRQGFLAYTTGQATHFVDLEWAAEMKVYHSPSLHVVEPHPALSIGRIKLSAGSVAIHEEEKVTTLDFEITLQDLNSMIRSLQDLKEALTNLEKKKLVEE